MPSFTSPNLIRWIAPVGGVVAGIVVVAICLLTPTMTLEDWVWRSGIAALVPAAQPPLGVTARAVLALSGGLLAAAVVWSGLFLLFGTGGFLSNRLAARSARNPGTPNVRRADAHPDAPVRKPLSVSDLGMPMPPVTPAAASPHPAAPPAAPVVPPVVQALPADLDQPLSAFDPEALLPVPREPVRPVAPLRAPELRAGERIDSIELPTTPHANDGEPSIESLLRRLEQGTRRHASAG